MPLARIGDKPIREGLVAISSDVASHMADEGSIGIRPREAARVRTWSRTL
jgi:hypothetical protein